MKVFAGALFALAAADEKKVPPRHPLQRLNKLNTFAAEWCGDNLTEKQARNWTNKFERNTARFARRFEQCGFYDENQLPHGGPKVRRDADDDEEIIRYDKTNPIRGIHQITKGFEKWAKRYIVKCKLQPGRQVDRAQKWNNQLLGMLSANQNKLLKQ